MCLYTVSSERCKCSYSWCIEAVYLKVKVLPIWPEPSTVQRWSVSSYLHSLLVQSYRQTCATVILDKWSRSTAAVFASSLLTCIQRVLDIRMHSGILLFDGTASVNLYSGLCELLSSSFYFHFTKYYAFVCDVSVCFSLRYCEFVPSIYSCPNSPDHTALHTNIIVYELFKCISVEIHAYRLF